MGIRSGCWVRTKRLTAERLAFTAFQHEIANVIGISRSRVDRLELRNWRTGAMIVDSALLRKESRGSIFVLGNCYYTLDYSAERTKRIIAQTRYVRRWQNLAWIL